MRRATMDDRTLAEPILISVSRCPHVAALPSTVETAVDTVLGLVAVVIGVASAIAPLALPLTPVTAASLVAVGVTITLVGLALSHRVIDVCRARWRSERQRPFRGV